MSRPPNLTKMLEEQKRLRQSMSGGSVMKMLEDQRRLREQMSGGSVTKMLEDQRRLREQMTGGSVTKMLEDQRRLRQQMTGGSVIMMLADSRKLYEQMTGGGVLRSFDDAQRRIRGMMARPGFAQMVGAHRAVAHITTDPDFVSMIGGVAAPRVEWESIFEGLRDEIGADVAEAVAVEFEAAADVADGVTEDVSWIDRLPVYMQFMLAYAVLEVLFVASEFMGDLTGEDMPPAFRSGTETLFKLLMVLIIYMQARDSS